MQRLNMATLLAALSGDPGQILLRDLICLSQAQSQIHGSPRTKRGETTLELGGADADSSTDRITLQYKRVARQASGKRRATIAAARRRRAEVTVAAGQNSRVTNQPPCGTALPRETLGVGVHTQKP